MLQFLLLCWSEPATTPASHPVLSLSLRARSFVRSFPNHQSQRETLGLDSPVRNVIQDHKLAE